MGEAEASLARQLALGAAKMAEAVMVEAGPEVEARGPVEMAVVAWAGVEVAAEEEAEREA